MRARAASTRQATRREVEQSIARFEKQLDGANDALKTLGTHLGRGTTASYKEVTAALTALRREASKTNKQALKDFDKLRAAITKPATSSRSNSGSKTSSRASKTSTAKASATKKASTTKASTRKASTRSAKASSGSTASKRSTAKRTTTSRAKSTRSKKTS